MRAVLAVFVLLWFTGVPLFASECPGNADALGTSRTLAVSPTEYPRVGSMQYGQTLPLDDHEVVLTFDDGPLSPYTGNAKGAELSCRARRASCLRWTPGSPRVDNELMNK